MSGAVFVDNPGQRQREEDLPKRLRTHDAMERRAKSPRGESLVVGLSPRFLASPAQANKEQKKETGFSLPIQVQTPTLTARRRFPSCA
jgi:hypothetical protein